MGSFLNYYVLRSIDPDEVISESSSEPFDATKFAKKNGSGSAFNSHVSRVHGKHPSAQRCDVEKALKEALKKVAKKKPSSKGSAKRLLDREAGSILSAMRLDGKNAKKSLSCIGSIKGFSSSGKSLESFIDRAGGILTANERRVLDLCSKGHSVRSIGSEMKISFPTAWRLLNSAVDKVRISHGMKSRHMDRR